VKSLCAILDAGKGKRGGDGSPLVQRYSVAWEKFEILLIDRHGFAEADRRGLRPICCPGSAEFQESGRTVCSGRRQRMIQDAHLEQQRGLIPIEMLVDTLPSRNWMIAATTNSAL